MPSSGFDATIISYDVIKIRFRVVYRIVLADEIVHRERPVAAIAPITIAPVMPQPASTVTQPQTVYRVDTPHMGSVLLPGRHRVNAPHMGSVILPGRHRVDAPHMGSAILPGRHRVDAPHMGSVILPGRHRLPSRRITSNLTRI